MLGMSNLAIRDPEYAIAVLVALDKIVSEVSKISLVHKKNNTLLKQPTTWTFSDSIVIVTESDTNEDWWAIIGITTTLFCPVLHE